ncbi:MAG: tetratricopeptide repeat protein [Pseudomonadota bacterium]
MADAVDPGMLTPDRTLVDAPRDFGEASDPNGNARTKTMKYVMILLLALAVPCAAKAFPSADQWSMNFNPELQARLKTARDLMEAEKFAEAIPVLTDLAKETPEEADVFNWLGFAYRNTGDLERSAAAYDKALTLEPNHLQALEYQGKLFLALHDLERAEANLRRIETLCSWPCEEGKNLSEAIAAARSD